MSENPTLKFLSLFVPDLAEAASRYEVVFGIKPSEDPGVVPQTHPFAATGPVVFDLGNVVLALYECDQRSTHPGDVGIGIEVDPGPDAMAKRARSQQGQVFFGPGPIADEGREMAIFVLPDRHFFEVVGRSP